MQMTFSIALQPVDFAILFYNFTRLMYGLKIVSLSKFLKRKHNVNNDNNNFVNFKTFGKKIV